VLALPTVEYDDSGALVASTLPRESQHMYLSTANFRPLTNGWSAYFPPSAGHLTAAVADLPSPGAFGALREAGVRTVVVQTGLIPGTRWEDVVPRLRAWPGVDEADHAEGVVVFDVSHASRTGPPG
jgi:hypothetical protein